MVLGPFLTTDEDNLKLPWTDLLRIVADCSRLDLLEFGLNDYSFEWTPKKNVDACLKHMISGSPIEYEAARWPQPWEH